MARRAEARVSDERQWISFVRFASIEPALERSSASGLAGALARLRGLGDGEWGDEVASAFVVARGERAVELAVERVPHPVLNAREMTWR
jgi:hypothetical protein